MKALCVVGVVGLWLCVMVGVFYSGPALNTCGAISGGLAAIGLKFANWGC